MQKFNAVIPLSLYIHIPWCVRKCPYCDFNSHEAKDTLPEELYVAALLKNFDEHLPLLWGRRFVSIFFGGGTPSLFSASSIEKILTGIHSRIPFGQDLEVTLEANPGTVDESRFADFRKAGINRLSIGIQSLQNDKLKSLGRIHDRDYALRAISVAKNAGFDNFNLDLMHGLPGQSLEDALADLQDALQFQPPHVSWYQLTIEPNTFFHRFPPALPQDETLWEIQERGKEVIADFSLSQYEVSAYAKKNHECVHNKNYWEFGDYLGIGAGAHSKLTDFENQKIIRFSQVKNPKDYLMDKKQLFSTVSERDTVFEFMLNALRLTHGVPLNLFTERTGLPISFIENEINKAKEKNLLSTASQILQPTELGLKFLNDLTTIFL